MSLTTSGGEISTTGPKNCAYPSASLDGNIISWVTTAEDTPAPPDGAAVDNPNNIHQMWVRNATTGVAHLVSGGNHAPTGRINPGNGGSERGSVSGNGKFAVFQSMADNFETFVNGVPSTDQNLKDDVWIYDVVTFQLSRLSSRPNGYGGNGRSWGPPEISEFGRYVTFTTSATDLVNVNTTNHNCLMKPRGGINNIVLLDRGMSNLDVNDPGAPARTIRWVSHGVLLQYSLPDGVPYSIGCTQPDGPSDEPSLSASGCKIAYRSQAGNLSVHDQFDPDSSSPIWHIYVYDTASGTNQLISKSSTGDLANDNCFWPEVSADGRFVVFSSKATNLDPDDTNFNEEVFIRDLQAKTTRLMHFAQDGIPFFGIIPANYSGGRNPEVSPSGRFVTYGCRVKDPASSQQDGLRAVTTVLLYDLDANNTGIHTSSFAPSEFEVQHLSLIQDAQANEIDANGHTAGPLMFGGDGEYVYFASEANDLLPPGADTNGSGAPGRDIFNRKIWQ